MLEKIYGTKMNDHFKGEVVQHKFGQLMTVLEDCLVEDSFIRCQYIDVDSNSIVKVFPRGEVSITLSGLAKLKIKI